ncbi:unnamed protein product, partial [Prorocentrum cordatum]
GEQWQRALALLSEMPEAKLKPNVLSYRSGISACEKCGQWQPALALLSEMPEATLEPNVISLQSWDQRVREGRAVAACAGTAERAAGREAGARRLVSCTTGISACGKGGQWQRALALLGEMWAAKLELDAFIYTAGVSACGKGGQWQRALALLGELWAARLEPDAFQLQCWDQCVREWRAVAAGAGPAERDAGGEAGVRRHQFQRWDQCVREV